MNGRGRTHWRYMERVYEVSIQREGGTLKHSAGIAGRDGLIICYLEIVDVLAVLLEAVVVAVSIDGCDV